MITAAFEYGNPITQGGGGGGGGTAEEWTRPDDWLAMPTVTAADEKFVGLHAVWPSDGNFVAVRCAGNYQVDWGDGTTTTHSANTTAYYEYSYSSISADTDSTRGYRQVLITITPQSGQTLTTVNLYQKHNQTGLANSYATGWLDMLMSLPNLSASGLTIGATSVLVRHALLERVTILEQGSCNTFNALFAYCVSLQKIQLDDTAAVTNFTNMFFQCRSLKTVDLFDTSAGTTFLQMFYQCSSLRNVPLFDTSSCLNAVYMFYNCESLQSLPLFNFSACTDFNNICTNNFSLNSIPAWDVSAATSSTSYINMFVQCALQAIDATGFRFTFSVANNKLSSSDLDTLYTNLATVGSQTITVSGNYGTTGDNPTIATAKGWTVTG